MISWSDVATIDDPESNQQLLSTSVSDVTEQERSEQDEQDDEEQLSLIPEPEVESLLQLTAHHLWDDFLQELSRSSLRHHFLTLGPWGFQDEEHSVLHAVLLAAAASSAAGGHPHHARQPDQNSLLPLSVVEGILQASGDPTALASTRNRLQQTPLHTTLYNFPERHDIVQCLVEAAPQTVQDRDSLLIRPVDSLCQKIIMAEELAKYAYPHTQEVLDALWITAQILVQPVSASSSPRTSPPPQPFVHACLQGVDVPWALTERAVKRYRHQLKEPNVGGDLPLHVISATPPRRTRHSDGDGEEEEDDEEELVQGGPFHWVLSLCPEAAKKPNRAGQIPLEVAIQSGRGWDSGIVKLLEANPAAVEELGVPYSVVPVLLERLGKSEQVDTIFGMLKEMPELCPPRSMTSTSGKYGDRI